MADGEDAQQAQDQDAERLAPHPSQEFDRELAAERRVRALRELAQTQTQAQQQRQRTERTSDRPPARGRRRRWVPIVAVLLAVAVVGAVVLGLIVRAHPVATRTVKPPTGLQIIPRADGLACLVDVAWSPDGTRLALAGYSTHCPDAGSQVGYEPGLVNVYDAATGGLVARWHPDDAILHGHGIALDTSGGPAGGTPDATSGPYSAPPYLDNEAILWSPDGQHIALPFFVQRAPLGLFAPAQAFLAAPPPAPPTIAGLLVAHPDGSQAQVFTAPYPDASQRQTASLEWDLTRGTLLSSAVALPPALAYQWGAGGVLLPQTPLSTDHAPAAAPPGLIGNPAGGAAFSLWQPGQAAPGLLTHADGSVSRVAGLNYWASAFAAWSPDGRYLLTPRYYGGRVAIPGQPAPGAAAVQQAGAAGLVLLPTRAAALQQVYTTLPPDQAAWVAWRPDGRVMAVQHAAGLIQSHAPISSSVTLYDATSGRQLATLTPVPATVSVAVAVQANGDFFTGWLRWSPDGRRLLLLDRGTSTLTLWGPGALPR